MNSPIKWIGGKRILRKEIIPLIPKCKCYVEVFGGAGWVLFGKNEKDHKVEVYNDINSELINFFKVVKYKNNEFLERFNYLLVAREIFDDFKYQDISKLSDVDRAFRFWYLLKYSYGGRKNTLNDYSFGYSKERKPPKLDNQKKLIDESYDRLKDVIIENLDYEVLLKKYDGKDTVFYLDPPYLVKGKFYGEFEFTKEDHIKLKENLSNINGKWILSINDNEFFRELYKEFNIRETSVNYSSGNANDGSGKRSELIISNF